MIPSFGFASFLRYFRPLLKIDARWEHEFFSVHFIFVTWKVMSDLLLRIFANNPMIASPCLLTYGLAYFNDRSAAVSSAWFSTLVAGSELTVCESWELLHVSSRLWPGKFWKARYMWPNLSPSITCTFTGHGRMTSNFDGTNICQLCWAALDFPVTQQIWKLEISGEVQAGVESVIRNVLSDALGNVMADFLSWLYLANA